jgi:hypothetical protein
MPMKLKVAPLTPDRWPDLEAVFQGKGCSVARGCWGMTCMWFGAKSMFDKAGFKEVARRKPQRPIVRIKCR